MHHKGILTFVCFPHTPAAHPAMETAFHDKSDFVLLKLIYSYDLNLFEFNNIDRFHTVCPLAPKAQEKSSIVFA